MPSFSTADGAPIPVSKIVDIGSEYWNLKRVELPIERGTIVIRYSGNDEPVATYTIDPTFTPRTRSVELLPSGMTLWVDSDAVAFRINGEPVSPMRMNDGRVHVVTGEKQRVVALYPNGSEEVIYDDVPIDQDAPAFHWNCDLVDEPAAPPADYLVRVPPEVLVLLLLGLAAFAHGATPRVD